MHAETHLKGGGPAPTYLPPGCDSELAVVPEAGIGSAAANSSSKLQPSRAACVGAIWRGLAQQLAKLTILRVFRRAKLTP